jgi:hypothetical protein
MYQKVMLKNMVTPCVIQHPSFSQIEDAIVTGKELVDG